MTETRTLRLLAIAPEIPTLPRLAQWDEIGQIGDLPGVRVESLGGPRVTLDQIAGRARQPHEIVIWMGHGQAGELPVCRGAATGEWLAMQLSQNPPRVAILSTCYSAARTDELRMVAEAISLAGINVVGMALQVEDTSAIAYDVEFVRSLVAGGDVRQAHLVALQQMRCINPDSARNVFLLPGLADNDGRIDRRLCAIEDRLGSMEATLRSQGEVLDWLKAILGRDGRTA